MPVRQRSGARSSVLNNPGDCSSCSQELVQRHAGKNPEHRSDWNEEEKQMLRENMLSRTKKLTWAKE